MTDFHLATPVAFLIFNRPDTTERVFAEIAKARPPQFLVVGDGPRGDRPGEAEKVAATRAIVERVDWNCEVLTNYSSVNLGCKNRVASGIDWVFEQVEEAIFLEDDCLPHPTFFRFCQELLERYRDDQRIAMISGDNFQCGRQRGEASYYFSRYLHIWGWASWRRAWRHYDRDVSAWPRLRDSQFLHAITANHSEREHWRQAFQAVHDGGLDTWDHQWTLAAWRHSMIAVMPNVNLISNIGFDAYATHTRRPTGYSALATQSMIFPLCHPDVIRAHHEADQFTARRMFAPPLTRRVMNYLKRRLG